MVRRRSAKDTAKLIEEVARGDRLIEDIKDPQLRETVRLALRLHKDPFSAPDARTRSRIRSRVLFGLHPQNATLFDRVAVAFELLGRPTPYAMRVLAIGLVVVAIGATSEYGEHMANAAAELAQVESLQPETATLVVQLQQRIDEHRATAVAV